eukprot:gene13229-13165_t
MTVRSSLDVMASNIDGSGTTFSVGFTCRLDGNRTDGSALPRRGPHAPRLPIDGRPVPGAALLLLAEGRS